MSTKKKKQRRKTPSFITEIPLRVSPAQERELLIRLDNARKIYNAVLGESLKRARLMRETRAYQAARKLPKTVVGKRGKKLYNPERAAAFAALSNEFGFSEFALHAYAKQFKFSWLAEKRFGIHAVQTVATRAFQAVKQYVYGKRGKPRFKGKNQYDSVQGKGPKNELIWRDGALRWCRLVLKAVYDENDAVIQHGLHARIKFARLVRRKLHGKNRFCVQLVCEGLPYRKKLPAKQGVVGLDIGPSTVAIVAPAVQHASLRTFCAELDDLAQPIAKLQRKIARQRRANNPDNFEPDRWVKKDKRWVRKQGKSLKGKREWHISKAQRRNAIKLAELQRRQAAYRKSLHGRLVNELLQLGTVFKLEKLSYRALQKNFGKSVGQRAPGMFVDLLRRKAESAGGVVDEFPTYSTRLSQMCLCGTLRKKDLNERWHACDCGISAQRDVFSAFLACAVEEDRLVASKAQRLWHDHESVVSAAASTMKPATGVAPPLVRTEDGYAYEPHQPVLNGSEQVALNVSGAAL